jgi:hypothetical protein
MTQVTDPFDIPPDFSGGKKTAIVIDGRKKIHTGIILCVFAVFILFD